MKTMRLLGAIVVLALCVQKSAFAQTFDSTSANIFNTGFDSGDLLVRWTESGLQPGASVNYTVTGTGITTYACVMGKREAVLLTPITATVSYGFTLPVSVRGTVSQTVDVEESDPLRNACQGMGKIVLYQVDWTDVYINDDTNHVRALVGGGNFSLTFCDLTKNPKNCPPPS